MDNQSGGDKYNPGDKRWGDHYDGYFNHSNSSSVDSDAPFDNETSSSLHDAETSTNNDTEPYDSSDSTETVKRSESSGSSNNWNVNVGSKSNAVKSLTKKVVLKKSAPIGAVIAVVLSIAGLVSFFGGPGLLIVHVTEMLTEKFNYQLGPSQNRRNRILKAKMENATAGCSRLSPAKCRFSTFSDREIRDFKKAGFKVNAKKTTILGRNVIQSVELDGKTYNAKDFYRATRSDPKFRNAVNTAFNMKYRTLSDGISKRTFKKRGVHKGRPFNASDTDSDRKEKIKARSKKITNRFRSRATGSTDTSTEEGKTNKPMKQIYTEYSKAIDENKNGMNTFSLANQHSAGMEAAKKATDIGVGSFKGLAGSVKITGALDDACHIHGTIVVASLISKVIKSAAMIEFALMFMKTAGLIKAGQATPADTNHMGNLITKVVTDKETGHKTKSGTDSYGYRYAAFGDKGIDDNASLAVVGVSFPDWMKKGLEEIYNLLGKKNINTACEINNNPAVQILSFGLGATLAFFTGGLSSIGNIALKTVIHLGVGFFISAVITPAIIDILTGTLINDDLFGESAMNVITSGAGALLSASGTEGGGMLAERGQTDDIMETHYQTIAEYKELDRSQKSPLDISSPNTFLGSLYSQLIPYFSSTSNLASIVTSISNISTSALSNIMSPKVSAQTDPRKDDTYSDCTDYDVVDMNLATDPFCNPISGIPKEVLDLDPIEIISWLEDPANSLDGDTPLIDEEGRPQNEVYKKYISQCFDRDVDAPFGHISDDPDIKGETKDCYFSTDTIEGKSYTNGSLAKKYMAAHYIDNRVVVNMEGDDPDGLLSGVPREDSITPEYDDILASQSMLDALYDPTQTDPYDTILADEDEFIYEDDSDNIYTTENTAQKQTPLEIYSASAKSLLDNMSATIVRPWETKSNRLFKKGLVYE